MADEASAVHGPHRPPYPLFALLLVGAAYEALLLFTSVLAPGRFPLPDAVSIFDGAFAVVGTGVAYLCLERHRLRRDARSAWLGITLWISGLLALAHIAMQPEYQAGAPAGVATYFFALSYLGSFLALGLAAHAGDRPFPLTRRQRGLGVAGGLGLALVLVLVVVQIHPRLPLIGLTPARFTPIAIWTFGLVTGAVALWALGSAWQRARSHTDTFSHLFVAAGIVWLIGFAGLLTWPYRDGIPWYVAGFARPAGLGLIFVALMREQIKLYRDARRRVRSLERMRNFGQALLQATSEREILAAAVHTTREMLGADASAVYLDDGSGDALQLEAGLGWDSGTVGVAKVPADGVHRFMAFDHVVAHGLTSGVSAPLALADIPLGLLAAFHRSSRVATDDERGFLTSVADQTALAIEKARLHAELQASVVQLQETQSQLIQADKLKALGTLLSGMAHELNNPLSTIQLSVQLVKRGELPDAVRRRLDVAEEECQRASRIIRDLLVFARRREPERKPTDLRRVLDGVAKLQSPEFELHRIRLITELDPMPAIMADGHQLQQVFLNLCTNATHAMKGKGDGGTLTIRALRRDGEVTVEVQDTGPGIPREHLARIFDPFFTTKAAGQGTGLGLSLSIGIVQAHGGRLDVTNVPGSGARFTVTLPIGTASDGPPATANGGRRALRSGRILIVDDEPLLRQTIADVVRTLGHTVETAGTGREALEMLERERFDAVTLDLRLPDIDGGTVWRQILARDASLAARVIFLTGDTMSPETQKFLDEAQRPVLTKPLTIDRIADLIQEMLAASEITAAREARAR